jgi:hypothetical protein
MSRSIYISDQVNERYQTLLCNPTAAPSPNLALMPPQNAQLHNPVIIGMDGLDRLTALMNTNNGVARVTLRKFVPRAGT